MKNLLIIGALVVLLATGLILLFSGHAVASAGGFSLDYFSAGSFSVGVFSAGIFSVGIFSAGIFSIGIFSIGIFNIGLYILGFFLIGWRKKYAKVRPAEDDQIAEQPAL